MRLSIQEMEIPGRNHSPSPLEDVDRSPPSLSVLWVEFMKNLAMNLKRFLKSEDGPTAVEYAVMLSLIIVVCLTAVRSIGTKASSTFTSVSTQLGSSS